MFTGEMFNKDKQPLLKSNHCSHFPLTILCHMKVKDLKTASA